MKVKDVMSKDVDYLSPDTTYEEAAKTMHERSLSSMAVCDRQGKLIGILSEKDLFRAMFPDYSEFYSAPESLTDEEEIEERVNGLRARPITEYMTRQVLAVEPSAALMKAGGLMLSHHVHHLPVIEDGKLIGHISREDVFSAILKHKLGF